MRERFDWRTIADRFHRAGKAAMRVLLAHGPAIASPGRRRADTSTSSRKACAAAASSTPADSIVPALRSTLDCPPTRSPALVSSYRPGRGGIGKVTRRIGGLTSSISTIFGRSSLPAALRLGEVARCDCHYHRPQLPGLPPRRNAAAGADRPAPTTASKAHLGVRAPQPTRQPRPRASRPASRSRSAPPAHARTWVDAFIAPSAFVELGCSSGRDFQVTRSRRFVQGSPRENTFWRASTAFRRATVGREGCSRLLEATRIASDVPVAVAGSGALAADVRNARVRCLARLIGRTSQTPWDRLLSRSHRVSGTTISLSQSSRAFAAGKFGDLSESRQGLPEISARW